MIREYREQKKIPKKYWFVVYFVIALAVGALFFLAQKKLGVSLQYMAQKSSIPPEYLANPQYCEKDEECVVFYDACGSTVINNYNFIQAQSDENLKRRDEFECSQFTKDWTNPRCKNNLCVGD